MSPVWLAKYVINKLTGPIFKVTSLRTEIPLNFTGEVAKGSGITWDTLNHTVKFIANMSKD